MLVLHGVGKQHTRICALFSDIHVLYFFYFALKFINILRSIDKSFLIVLLLCCCQITKRLIHCDIALARALP